MKTLPERPGWRIMSATLAGLLLAAGALSAAPIPDPPKPAEAAAERIRKALDMTLTVDYEGTTFGEAMSQLREKTKLNLVVDRVALQQTGINVDDQPIQKLHLKEVKARTVLRQLLAQLPQVQDFDPITGQARPGGLTYVVDDDIILITFEGRAFRRMMAQKVNVDAEKSALDIVLKQIANDTGVNVVLDPRQLEKVKDIGVTLRLTQVPVETAVRLVAEMAGMRSVKMSNVLFVTSKETAAEIKKEEEGPFNQQMLDYFRRMGIPPPTGFPGFDAFAPVNIKMFLSPSQPAVFTVPGDNVLQGVIKVLDPPK